MKTDKRMLFAISVAVSTCLVLGASAAEKRVAQPAAAEALFRGATNIVFSQQSAATLKQFTVRDPADVRGLIASIHLKLAPQPALEFPHQAKLQGPSGEVSIQFSQSYLAVGPDRETYATPKQFYRKFAELARKHGWRVEGP